mmetsp:Transcript_121667/g.192649  ORF Transcript_121667/g.192649 Transcript_121667/m.192649 type:complete len:352 (-) Transcript_121667:580-1635(-)
MTAKEISKRQRLAMARRFAYSPSLLLLLLLFRKGFARAQDLSHHQSWRSCSQWCTSLALMLVVLHLEMLYWQDARLSSPSEENLESLCKRGALLCGSCSLVPHLRLKQLSNSSERWSNHRSSNSIWKSRLLTLHSCRQVGPSRKTRSRLFGKSRALHRKAPAGTLADHPPSALLNLAIAVVVALAAPTACPQRRRSQLSKEPLSPSRFPSQSEVSSLWPVGNLRAERSNLREAARAKDETTRLWKMMTRKHLQAGGHLLLSSGEPRCRQLCNHHQTVHRNGLSSLTMPNRLPRDLTVLKQSCGILHLEMMRTGNSTAYNAPHARSATLRFPRKHASRDGLQLANPPLLSAT